VQRPQIAQPVAAPAQVLRAGAGPSSHQPTGTPVASRPCMNRALLVPLALAAACDSPAPPPSASLPWIRGLEAATVSDTVRQPARRRHEGRDPPLSPGSSSRHRACTCVAG
jgi:hypothetical protein